MPKLQILDWNGLFIKSTEKGWNQPFFEVTSPWNQSKFKKFQIHADQTTYSNSLSNQFPQSIKYLNIPTSTLIPHTYSSY